MFSKEDLNVWRNWITWLGKEGDTPCKETHHASRGDEKTLLAELRQQMLGAHGHQIYRVPSEATGDYLPRLKELFSSNDLEEFTENIA